MTKYRIQLSCVYEEQWVVYRKDSWWRPWKYIGYSWNGLKGAKEIVQSDWLKAPKAEIVCE